MSNLRLFFLLLSATFISACGGENDGTALEVAASPAVKNTVSAKTLSKIAFSGCPSSMDEGTTHSCEVIAVFSDGSQQNVTGAATVTENSPYANINNRNQVVTGQVASDQTMVLTANYTYNGTPRSTLQSITIKDTTVAVTVKSLSLNCPATIQEKKIGNCTATVVMSDNTSANATQRVQWSVSGNDVTINGNGTVVAKEVTGSKTITVKAVYTLNGKPTEATRNLTVSDTPKTLSKIAFSGCPSSVDEGTTHSCPVIAVFSDGSQQTVTGAATVTENSPYASINNQNKVVTGQVASDQTMVLTANYTYNGTPKSTVQSITVKDTTVAATVKSLSISCNSPLDEKKIGNCTATVVMSDNTSADVTRSVEWSVSTDYATINSNGTMVAKEVTGDKSVIVKAVYTTNGVSTEKTSTVSIYDTTVITDPPIVVTPPVTNEIGVTLTNRYRDQQLTINGNSEWIFKNAGGGSFYYCEKDRPTYCLNTLYGDLRSTEFSIENADYSKWDLEIVGEYKRIKSSASPSYYIHQEEGTVEVGEIQSGWLSAHWKMEGVENDTTSINVESFEFISKSNNSIKLTVGGNSDWVLKKDTIYGTDAYKVCEKSRADYCLNIENNDILENSEIKVGWYSALWTIEKFSDGSLYIRSKWKPNKYISINDSGVTLTTDRNISVSMLQISRKILDSISALFISTAFAGSECAETDPVTGDCILTLYFGDSLVAAWESFDFSSIPIFYFPENERFELSESSNINELSVEIIGDGSVKSFSNGEYLTFTATGNESNLFAGWSGGDCGARDESQLSETCTVLSSSLNASPLQAVFVDPEGDEDGDGLLNKWEIEEYYDDGYTENLKELGANPLRKDIFVEVDYMPGRKPADGVFDDIVNSFNNSPVKNKYANDGISLHIKIGQELDSKIEIIGSNNAINVTDSLTSLYTDIKSIIKFDERKIKYSKYTIIGYEGYGLNGSIKSGASPNSSLFYMLISEAKMNDPTEWKGVFMHELGHTLGLKHGGNDGDNYKPNYLSVMNYSFQNGLVTNDSSRMFDYSRKDTVSGILNENSLDESQAIYMNNNSGLSHLGTYYYCDVRIENEFLDGYTIDIDGQEKFIYKVGAGKLSEKVDWNCDGNESGRISADINGNGVYGESLSSFDDWSNLEFKSAISLETIDSKYLE